MVLVVLSLCVHRCFWEAFFHHAAFSSGGKDLVCDIQAIVQLEEDTLFFEKTAG